MIAISKHFRWSLAARGAASILFGAMAWIWPQITLLTLMILFGVYALIDGASATAGSLVHRKALKDWWLVLLTGVASMLLGVMIFARPGVTALVLLFFIAARALIVGGLEIAAAIRYRHEIRNEWLLIAGGALSLLFGLSLFAFPIAGALAVVWLIGLYSIALGVLQLAFAYATKSIETAVPAETEEHRAIAA